MLLFGSQATMSRWANRRKKKPAGWDYIEPTLMRLEQELRDGASVCAAGL